MLSAVRSLEVRSVVGGSGNNIDKTRHRRSFFRQLADLQYADDDDYSVYTVWDKKQTHILANTLRFDFCAGLMPAMAEPCKDRAITSKHVLLPVSAAAMMFLMVVSPIPRLGILTTRRKAAA